MSDSYSLDFPRAYGELTASADFRTEPEDFQVDEFLGFEPAGQGEHVYLHVCKRGENTAWVAEKIAQLANVQVMDVGYCGRKDRHAVTAQWFSVYLPKVESEPDWAALNSDTIQLLSVARHTQKLRRGDHQKNHFVIRLRNLVTEDKKAFEQKLDQVLLEGVPNYYGEQRFGRNGNNLNEAQAILVERKQIRDKQRRSLYLSAARSYLFNLVVAARVAAGNWQVLLDGEPETVSSAPLWGRGRSLAHGALAEFEQSILDAFLPWCNGLEHAGLSQERRSLVLKPENPTWRWDGVNLILAFALGSGEFTLGG
jgi:tRNA pseudouridine13 synthase